MKIERRAGADDERKLLIGMIVDRVFLGRMSAKWSGNMLSAKSSNLLASWCVEYFKKYKDAPKKHIESVFKSWVGENPQNPDTAKTLELFLSDLSGEYETKAAEINPEYLTDLAGKYLNKVRVHRLIEAVRVEYEAGKISRAEKLIANHRRVELGQGEAINVMSDKQAMIEAFQEDQADVVTFPGALGEFFRGNLQRDSFVVIFAPEKRGKSFWLIDMAWQAMLQRKKVAFFAVGDMSQRQMMRRFACRAAQHPRKSGKLIFPRAIRVRAKDKIQMKSRTMVFEKPLGPKRTISAIESIQLGLKSKKEFLKMSVHAADTLTPNALDAQLETWAEEGWMPDVVIVDYVDILKMDEGDDERERTNKCWLSLRRISQTRHCLVYAATQTNAASYKAGLINRSHFSNDKRKLAHVSAVLGLNQSPAEKKMGVYRLNWVLVRENEYSESKCVYVAGNLGVAHPTMCSCWPTFKEGPDERKTE